MARHSLRTIVCSLLVATSVTFSLSCVPPSSLDGRPCACASVFVCCEALNVCLPPERATHDRCDPGDALPSTADGDAHLAADAVDGLAADTETPCLTAPMWIDGPVGIITDPLPLFLWAAVPGAIRYTLYVLTIPEEIYVVRRIDITETSFRPPWPLPLDHDMRWKVKGEGSCGAGEYATGSTFRVSSRTFLAADSGRAEHTSSADRPIDAQGE